ncbi:MAG: hypothetical protein Q9220_004381 [cf. Caloplaca sp. 1 TL-2023]
MPINGNDDTVILLLETYIKRALRELSKEAIRKLAKNDHLTALLVRIRQETPDALESLISGLRDASEEHKKTRKEQRTEKIKALKQSKRSLEVQGSESDESQPSETDDSQPGKRVKITEQSGIATSREPNDTISHSEYDASPSDLVSHTSLSPGSDVSSTATETPFASFSSSDSDTSDSEMEAESSDPPFGTTCREMQIGSVEPTNVPQDMPSRCSYGDTPLSVLCHPLNHSYTLPAATIMHLKTSSHAVPRGNEIVDEEDDTARPSTDMPVTSSPPRASVSSVSGLDKSVSEKSVSIYLDAQRHILQDAADSSTRSSVLGGFPVDVSTLSIDKNPEIAIYTKDTDMIERLKNTFRADIRPAYTSFSLNATIEWDIERVVTLVGRLNFDFVQYQLQDFAGHKKLKPNVRASINELPEDAEPGAIFDSLQELGANDADAKLHRIYGQLRLVRAVDKKVQTGFVPKLYAKTKDIREVVPRVELAGFYLDELADEMYDGCSRREKLRKRGRLGRQHLEGRHWEKLIKDFGGIGAVFVVVFAEISPHALARKFNDFQRACFGHVIRMMPSIQNLICAFGATTLDDFCREGKFSEELMARIDGCSGPVLEASESDGDGDSIIPDASDDSS